MHSLLFVDRAGEESSVHSCVHEGGGMVASVAGLREAIG